MWCGIEWVMGGGMDIKTDYRPITPICVTLVTYAAKGVN